MVQNKTIKLSKISDELINSVCPLRLGATQPVPGAGNPKTEILLIGEAPGEQEDLLGQPFVGAAG
ncbi:uracil-DNA glycosylase, partial [Candidatus Berkelbacteria bacterium CG10_big_fil_rev_8_21_14_0_10_33_10]